MNFEITFIDKGNEFEGKVLTVHSKGITDEPIELTSGSVIGIKEGPVFEVKSAQYIPKEDTIKIEALYDSPIITRK